MVPVAPGLNNDGDEVTPRGDVFIVDSNPFLIARIFFNADISANDDGLADGNGVSTVVVSVPVSVALSVGKSGGLGIMPSSVCFPKSAIPWAGNEITGDTTPEILLTGLLVSFFKPFFNELTGLPPPINHLSRCP